MNSIFKIKSLINIFFQKQISLSEKIVNPKRDWNILIFFFIIFILISVIYDYYIYQKITKGEIYISINKEDLVIENLKSDDLQKILDNFEIKENNIISD